SCIAAWSFSCLLLPGHFEAFVGCDWLAHNLREELKPLDFTQTSAVLVRFLEITRDGSLESLQGEIRYPTANRLRTFTPSANQNT
ncbi:hypothetical protein D915_004211, partial [Fasciola hepatica]